MSRSDTAGNVRRILSMFFVAVLVAVSAAAVLNPGVQIESPFGGVVDPVDEIWVLVSAALVFFMQAGFLAYEVGLARPVHATVVAMKNVVDWTISTLGFFVVGFGLMFGASDNGLFGTDLFLLSGLADVSTTVSGGTFFLFQLAFAGTAITLVSGSLVERTTLLAYSAVATVIAVVMYPVFGHWVWGQFLNPDNASWLANLGFHDFAGGSVVHLLGATVALVGLVMIGPRIGRFGPDGEVNEFPPTSIGMTVLGVMVLWFGWWGFNGGSHLGLTSNVTGTILNTNLAAVAGLMAGGLWAYFFQQRYAMNTKLVGGAIGGLVAITSSADIMTPLGAVAVGLVAGIIYSLGHDLLLKLKVDDALGVVPAHGFCGIWGLIALALFAPAEALANDRLTQLGVQLTGVVACIAWAGALSFVVFMAVQQFIGLRVSPAQELGGMTLENEVPADPVSRAKARSAARKAKADARMADQVVAEVAEEMSQWERVG